MQWSRHLIPLVVTLGLLPGCGPSQKPKPAQARQEPPPPPPPKGDLLRLAGKAGTTGQGKVSIRVEDEPLDEKGGKRSGTVRAYTLIEQHTIAGVEPDGTQHVTAKLLDVEGKTDNPREQKKADAMARALSELKITFDRTSRGDVSSAKLEVDGVTKPLDAGAARIIAGSIYGAGRGPIFAEKHTDVGESWTNRAEVTIQGGGSNNWEIEYKYDKREGPVAFITFSGKSSGTREALQITGDVKGELRFDIQAGTFLSLLADTKTVFDPGPQAPAPGKVLRIHMEWEAEPVKPAQPAQQ